MSEESPPTYTTSIFNQANFGTAAEGLDTAYLNSHYLRYPTAQTGTETIPNLATTNDATINGLTVGKGSGNISTNTAFGVSALLNNNTTTPLSNTAIGYQALTANTTGSSNTAVGSGALSANTIGSSNTAVGAGALDSVAGGGNNTGMGYRALFNSTASYNTAVGSQALLNTTSGGYNTAVGSNALDSNTTGIENTAVGSSCLYSAVSVSQNTAIGHEALYATTNGTQTAVGFHAARNATGTNNLAIGYRALKGGVGTNTGNFNTAIGEDALFSNTSGSNNTAIGYQAGNAGTANTTGSNNTYIGYQAQADANNYSNSTALGSGAAIGKSNQIVLGTSAETVVIGGGTIATTNYTATQKLLLCGAASSSSNIGFTLTSGITDTDCKRWGAGADGYGPGSAYNIYAVDDDGLNPLYYFSGRKYKSGATVVQELVLNSSGGNTSIANLTTNGTVITTGSGYLSVSSDRRLKENIKYYEEDSIEKILQLKPATYNLIGKQDEYLGFIAQDVEPVIPEAIDGKKYEYNWLVDKEGKPILDEDGNLILDYTSPRYRGLNNTAITAVLVKAFQQQNQYIKKLEERILALEKN